ncbi:MAG: hypothetical protein KJ050_09650 [Candidatus Omnitrophica bacterium]|nr:hypothetical protein [Candidatus Omnitrophota bacterium]
MRLFIIGIGPLPFYRSPRPATALSDGTWQVIQPLLEDGHSVRAVTFEFGQRGQPIIQYLHKPRDVNENFEHLAFPEPNADTRALIAEKVQQAMAAFNPHAIISAGSVIASWVTSHLRHRLPLWYDLKGAFIPELQLRMESPDARGTFETFTVYKQVLLRGDRFSAVTEHQAHMLMGELGMVGRLNPSTLHEHLVTVKPTGLDPGSPSRMPSSGRIRGRLCGPEDFVLFSSGGFNTWQDTRTFFETIERVLGADKNVVFVCIGGGIGGHHDQGYESFKTWVSQSPYRSRMFLEGWVPQDQVVEYESEADLGVNFDLDVPESRYGDRSRFLSWMARRVGIATTPVSQPSAQLIREELAIGLPLGDSEGAAKVILDAAAQPGKVRAMAEHAEQFARTRWSYRETTRHLREWAQHPCLAGDNQKWLFSNDPCLQQRLAFHELALDGIFTNLVRQPECEVWKKVQEGLHQRWPWSEKP